MWTILQRSSTPARTSSPPVERPAKLRAITRLWQGRRTRSKASSTQTAKISARTTQPMSYGIDLGLDLSAQETGPRSTLAMENSGEQTVRRSTLRAENSGEYKDSLLTLRGQHAVLSAERNQLDQTDVRQRERVADLEARLHYLRQNLDLTPPSPSQITQPVPPLEPQTPQWSLGPVNDYPSALAAAQHWQSVARQLMSDLNSMNHLVRVDSLTGLRNRRSFDEQLPREVSRAQREDAPFCLLFIDIDHFKRVNDTFGHPAGDAVLRSVACCIVGCTRPSDHTARYGGEEFAVILSDVDIAQAVAVAERIRRQVQHADHCPHQVTVSIGVAEYRPQPLGGPAHDELISEADRALYAAKRGGRNRVQAITRRMSLH